MVTSSLIKHDDPRVEPAVPDEEAKTDRVASLINQIQSKNFSLHRHGFRGTHVKTQAVVKGSLSVLPDLPAFLSQGLFSQGGKEHKIVMRFANEPHWIKDDRAPGPRGCGIKVFEVDGDFLDPIGRQTRTQDFTFNNAPILELKDVTTTAEIINIRCRNFEDAEGLKKEIEKRDDKDLQTASAGLPNQHFVSYAMYSQSAYRYGDYVVKYGIFPTSKMQQELEKRKIEEGSDPEQHSLWLREYFLNQDATYDFRVQLCKDVEKQPVEDTSVEWDQEQFPFETVARITLPKQDAFDPARRAFYDDRMKLNVWYGLEAHKPLGSVNRLRKVVYTASSEMRAAVNAVQYEAISSIDDIP